VLVNVIIRLMLSVSLGLKVIPLSGTHCIFYFLACRRAVQTEVQVRPPRVRLASTGPNEDGDQLVRPLQRRLQGAALR